MYILDRCRMFLVHFFILFAVAECSTTEDRKIAYRNAVLANYTESTVLEECICIDDRIKPVFPDPPDCSFDEQGDYYYGTNFVDGLNPGIAIFPNANLPIPREDFALEQLLCRVTCEKQSTSDFSLTILMRTLYEGDGVLRAKIVNRLQEEFDSGDLRLWQAAGETNNIYYTENHMCMWLSATYLLKDKLAYNSNDEAFANVDRRLEYYLRSKLQYGYYEWFSTNYMPFTLAGLLNLVDFAPAGSTIQTLATEAAKKLLSDWLLFLNDAGHYYPVAARAKNHDYYPIFHTNTWILKGTGVPLGVDRWKHEPMGQFLALTSLNLEDLAATWQPIIDTEFTVGHSINDHDSVHSSLPREERVLYQWSAGAVAQPPVIDDSFFGVRFYKLVGDSFIFNFLLYPILGLVPEFISRLFARILAGQSLGSDYSSARVRLYKNKGVVLTSLQDYYGGARGFEQFPLMATVKDIAVYTQSGPDVRCMKATSGSIANTHLPKTVQDKHVALISYKPRWDVRIPFGFLFGSVIGFNLRVALAFPVEKFDQVEERGQWIMGRRDTSYVGVWRYDGLEAYDCSNDVRDGKPCDQYFFSKGRVTNRASTWVIIVGNDDTHESFDKFVSVVGDGIVTEKSPHLLESLWQGYYRTSVSVDGVSIESEM